jgi:RNA-directed DNA polymerase
MTLRGSDDRIVPKRSADQAEGDKPSNIGVGKAVGISRDPDRAPSALSGGTTVLTRLDRTSQRAKADPEAVFNNLFSMLNYELMWYAFRLNCL